MYHHGPSSCTARPASMSRALTCHTSHCRQSSESVSPSPGTCLSRSLLIYKSLHISDSLRNENRLGWNANCMFRGIACILDHRTAGRLLEIHLRILMSLRHSLCSKTLLLMVHV